MPDRELTAEQVLTMLADTPPRIAALTAGLKPDQLQTAAADEWSANDVLAHLRSCADVWGKYMLAIIAEDKPRFRAVSPRSWIKKTDYLEQEFQPSLQAFTRQRTDLLGVLESLTPEGWSRAATVTMVGRVLEQSVLAYARRLVLHEREHVRQIEHLADTMRLDGQL